MKNKILGIFVMTLMIATAVFPTVGSIKFNDEAELYPRVEIENNDNNDKVDQQQPITNSYTFVNQDAYRAQSFVPQLKDLTRVELKMYKFGNINTDIVVSIRNNLHGDDLTLISKQANQIPPDPEWITFNFDDLKVTPGNTYYIVCITQGGNLDNCYVLGMADYDAYPPGDAWEYGAFTGYTWEKMTSYGGTPNDLSFKTYCQKAKAKFEHEHQFLLQFFEWFPNMFPILTLLLQRLGLQ